jgi:hypothetical protein
MNHPAMASHLDTSALVQFKQMQISDNDDCEFEYAFHGMLHANFLCIRIQRYFKHTLNYDV